LIRVDALKNATGLVIKSSAPFLAKPCNEELEFTWRTS
jgi:hypothetical protein